MPSPMPQFLPSYCTEMPLFRAHSINRGPLSPAVSLDGSETVPGLRALERSSLVAGEVPTRYPETTARHAPIVDHGRRYYKRYRGPYVEQLTFEHAQAYPKPWSVFFGTSLGYSLPASITVLQERAEENLVVYLPNYVRLAVAITLLVMYLRPKALLGTIAVVASAYIHLKRALRRQAEQQLVQQQRAAGGRAPAAAAATAFEAAEQQQAPVTALTTIGTWLLVAYTRCFPMILLSLLLSSVAVLGHAITRNAPSESRYRGKLPLGYSWEVVRGRRLPSWPGADPHLVFKQLWWLGRALVVRKVRQAVRYYRYAMYVARESLQSRREAFHARREAMYPHRRL